MQVVPTFTLSFYINYLCFRFVFGFNVWYQSFWSSVLSAMQYCSNTIPTPQTYRACCIHFVLCFPPWLRLQEWLVSRFWTEPNLSQRLSCPLYTVYVRHHNWNGCFNSYMLDWWIKPILATLPWVNLWSNRARKRFTEQIKTTVTGAQWTARR